MKTMKYLLATALATCLCACEIEHSENGQLDGMWHLVQADTLATGGKAMMGEGSVFWQVQGKLLSARKDPYNYFLFHFNYQDGVLELKDGFKAADGVDERKLEADEEIEGVGICTPTDRFNVSHIGKNDMVLESKRLRLAFRRH